MGDPSSEKAWHFIRILQILSLIVGFSMLAGDLSNYQQHHATWPGSIGFIFALEIGALIYTTYILLAFAMNESVPLWVIGSDLLVMLLLVIAVGVGSKVAVDECDKDDVAPPYACGLIKGGWGLGVANVVLFFASATLTPAVAEG